MSMKRSTRRPTISTSNDLRRYARNYFQHMGQEEQEERARRLICRLLGLDDVVLEHNRILLAPSLRKALEAVVA